MLGEGQKFDEVVGLVRDWVPEEDYDHETHFRNDLLEYLDSRLNESGGDMFGMGQSQKDYVERESGGSNVDLSANQTIAIEMKRNFTNGQGKKLRGQIESYLDNYSYLIVCACGVQHKDQRRKLQNKYEGTSGFGMNQSEIVFIEKEPEHFGEDNPSDGGGGGFDFSSF